MHQFHDALVSFAERRVISMKTTHKEEIYVKSDKLTDKLYDEESIFFDIETTGFSPANSSVYLIGCARRKGKYICIDQYFAENPSEEKIIISAFMGVYLF